MKRPGIHGGHEGARRGLDLFIGVHRPGDRPRAFAPASTVPKAVLLASLLALGLVVGGARADSVMLADGQLLAGDLQPGETAGELRLMRFGETPLTVKREDIL